MEKTLKKINRTLFLRDYIKMSNIYGIGFLEVKRIVQKQYLITHGKNMKKTKTRHMRVKLLKKK